MAFEKFISEGRKTFKPKVSIRKSGQIGFNKAAVDKFELEKCGYVVLYYDKDNNLIGIKPTNDQNEEGVYKLNIKNSNGTIGCKTFMDYYGIKIEGSIKYDVSWEDETKEMLIIDISTKT